MENASKALLMAGGILIALLVIGALMLMFNQLSYYQKSNSDNKKESQLVDFNKEYVQYTYDDLKGYELISLINKVNDYNSKTDVGNSVDYDKKITVNITLTGFENKAGVDGKLTVFNKATYTDIANAITKFTKLENDNTLDVMVKLSANYDSIKNDEKTIADVAGKSIPNIDLNTIKQYREYSEFKSSTFKSNAEPTYYNNGQIKQLSFKYIK